MRLYLFIIIQLLLGNALQAQQNNTPTPVDVAQILANKNMRLETFFYADLDRVYSVEQVAKQARFDSLIKSVPLRKRVPNIYVAANIYLKFTLTNSSDSLQTFYYTPGSLFPVFEIYEITDSGVKPYHLYRAIKEIEDVKNHGYKLLQIPAHKTVNYILKLRFVKTTINFFSPKLVRYEYASQQVWADISLNDELGIITFIITGFFMMMIFYSLANYRQAYRPEFLYYGGYTLCVSALLFLKSILVINSSAFNFMFEGYLDFLIQLTSVFLYLLFVRSYLNTKVNYPFINNLLRYSQWVVVAATLLYTYVYFATDDFLLQNNLELYTKIYLVLLGIIFIVTGFRYKDRLLKYLVWGNIILIFFGLVSLFFIVSTFRFKQAHWIFSNSLMYYDLSVLGECILFLVGLSYKNRIELIEKVTMQEALKREKERQEMEKQIAIINTQQEERNRISADMHDELGAGMTAIRLMSEMAKVKTTQNPVPEIDKISDSANDLLNKMNAIIWSMNSSNDSLPNLVSYIRSYSLTYFENFDINCKVNVATEVPELEVSGEKRRNIFLTVKEALNNVVKHAQATEVTISFSFNGHIYINIDDNGKGINVEAIREFGNGLKNMRKRMERIGGRFEIENNHGTHISLIVPYT
jgi:signal transduction histidine kinase